MWDNNNKHHNAMREAIDKDITKQINVILKNAGMKALDK